MNSTQHFMGFFLRDVGLTVRDVKTRLKRRRPRYSSPEQLKQYAREQNARKVRARMAAAEAVITIARRDLMEMCLQVAVAHGVPVNALLSRLQVQPVVAARDELWRRANVELRMSPAEIARVFHYSNAAVTESLSRS